MKNIKFILPFLLFVGIILVLGRGLSLHPNQVPSPLINQASPKFMLPDLMNANRTVSNEDFYGHVTLLNVWASWCFACADEHAMLLEIAKNPNLIVYGLNYKDNPEEAIQVLKQRGNPFDTIAVDEKGDVAIDFGVYGVPETFIIDKKGIIRYKQLGPITQEIWQQKLSPIVERLEKET